MKKPKNSKKIQKSQKKNLKSIKKKPENKNNKKIVPKSKNLKNIWKIIFYFFLPPKKMLFPILGGRNSTRALQSSLFQKYKNLKKYFLKITFFTQKNLRKKKFSWGEKCYPLSFAILGGRYLTRALQSSLFQNPGGVPWAWRRRIRTEEIIVSNLGCKEVLQAWWLS